MSARDLRKNLDVPVLLWGPLDERPEPNGVRLRDTQCGLFATGKSTAEISDSIYISDKLQIKRSGV